MTRAFNIEGLVHLQNYMGGKTLSDAQFFAVLNADVVEMPLSSGTTRCRYYRQQETGTSITFINTNPTWLNYISVDKNTKRVTFNSTNFLTGSAGSITSEMLADGAVTGKKLANGSVGYVNIIGNSISTDKLRDGAVTSEKLADFSVINSKLGQASVGRSKMAFGSVSSDAIITGAVTSEKLAPGLDVSSLFFILPEGTRLPYTLTEEDKTKISAAIILMLPTTNGVVPFQRGPKQARLWCSFGYVSTFWTVTVSESSISAPVAYKIVDDTAVKFTPPNPHRRAENAGENEHRRSGRPEYVRRSASYVGGAARCRRRNYTVIRYVICSYCTENRSRSVRR